MMIRQKNTNKARSIAFAAIEAIHEKGLDRFKLTDVARKAGVTTGAVTYYFDDKDALLVAAFEETWDQLFKDIEAYSGGWQINRFLNSLPVTESIRRRWSVWLAFCGRAQTSTMINSHYRKSYKELENVLLASIQPDDPDQFRLDIRTTIAAMDGIGLSATLHPELWPAERQRECLKNMLAHLFPIQKN